MPVAIERRCVVPERPTTDNLGLIWGLIGLGVLLVVLAQVGR